MYENFLELYKDKRKKMGKFRSSRLKDLFDILEKKDATLAEVTEVLKATWKEKKWHQKSVREKHGTHLRALTKAIAMDIGRLVALGHSDVLIPNVLDYVDKKTYIPPFYQDVDDDILQSLDARASLTSTSVMAKFLKDNTRVKKKDCVKNNNYQLKLGEFVAQLKAWPPWYMARNKIKIGKCFQCAALVAWELNSRPAFTALGLSIEICENKNVKHYFNVIGRKNITDDLQAGIRNTKAWGDTSFIIDMWHANMNNASALTGRALDDTYGVPAVVEFKDYQYNTKGDVGTYSVQNRWTFD